MPRPQFSLKTMLWLMLAICPVFLGGFALGRKVEQEAIKPERGSFARRRLELEGEVKRLRELVKLRDRQAEFNCPVVSRYDYQAPVPLAPRSGTQE
ncbi:MAG TPA: hypothetical protein VG125_09890 [Pirellulales bacterium]|jgi:hypothetical protein|nr:hypothetical protein [Pirellulales bacterium]